MIKINLLPTKAARKKENVINQLVVAGIALGVSVGVLYFVHLHKNQEIAAQRVKNTRLQEEINQLTSIIAQVEDYKKKKQDRNSKIEIIRKLNEGRSGPVKLMDEFTYLLPDKAWISTWQEKNKKLEINGSATNGSVIADFLENLKNSKYFSDIELVQTQGEAKGESSTQGFKVTMSVNYTPD